MEYIDLHAHMVSRTTDDYRAMAMSGCVAVTEPAFWAGYDRPGVDAFVDYFNRLTDFEPKRAATYGIAHFTWMCLNPKEAEDRELTRRVLEVIPRYLEMPTVLGIGEIGLNRVTRNELAGFKDHVDLAMEHEQLIHIHTPHLEDKWKGTKVIVETLAADADRAAPRDGRPRGGAHGRHDPRQRVLDRADAVPGHEGLPARAVDVLETRGPDRICVAAACDWGESRPWPCPSSSWRCAAAAGLADPARGVREPDRVPRPVAEVQAARPRRCRGRLVVVGDGLHLTYCTNIHPAVGWEAVLDSLHAHARR